MGTLKEDIQSQANWIIQAFAADGYTLDYSIKSTMELDKFFFQNMVNGQAKKRGRLDGTGYGTVLFAMGAYLGETIIKNIPGTIWLTDDDDPEGELTVAMQLPDETIVWPIQRVMQRFQEGKEEAIYPYAHALTTPYLQEEFDDSFWQLEASIDTSPIKPWWKFW